ncbi:uncharacterized protein LOC125048306 [Penaeus chinensis]|uniref:uncharacterized protein LOC125048306 n=1 Tax=Penaeus chinensis TaxID=139456 RepID=UPI001FB85EBF|nr:uncharacterized protein LOC125048306 [Penaeus chinensis]
MNFRVVLLVALAAAVCSAQEQSPLGPLLELVTAEELDLFMKASSINLDTCIGILKNGAKCRMGAKLFLKLANSLSDSGFQCNTCSPEHQSLIDRTLAKVRASPDCPALATAIAHANLC